MRKSSDKPRQIFGPFRPTPYGRTILPQLTGILRAGAALQQELASRGMSESLPEASVLEEFLETSPAGQRMMNVGRIIADLELQDASGTTVTFETIGFRDLADFRAGSGLRTSAPVRGGSAGPESQVVVSATLARRSSGLMQSRITVT